MTLDNIHAQLAQAKSAFADKPDLFVVWSWVGDASMGPSHLRKGPMLVQAVLCGQRTALVPHDVRIDGRQAPDESKDYATDGGRMVLDTPFKSITLVEIEHSKGAWTPLRDRTEYSFNKNSRSLKICVAYPAGLRIRVTGKTDTMAVEVPRLFVTTADGQDLDLPLEQARCGLQPICDLCPNQINCLQKRYQPFRKEDYQIATGHRST